MEKKERWNSGRVYKTEKGAVEEEEIKYYVENVEYKLKQRIKERRGFCLPYSQKL